jgi:hypothetical protein
MIARNACVSQERKRKSKMKPVAVVLLVVLMCCAMMLGCRRTPQQPERRPLEWSGWIEETALKRGYVQAGDIARFGCPPGWLGVEDTAAALRGHQASAIYTGKDPLPREGTVTCVAQAEFALPPAPTPGATAQAARQPLSPVWVDIGPDSTTIGFRSEVSLNAAIYIGRDTPCGPRVIGVRLGDLLKWLADPQSATKRDFLGMLSAGCPEKDGAR